MQVPFPQATAWQDGGDERERPPRSARTGVLGAKGKPVTGPAWRVFKSLRSRGLMATLALLGLGNSAALWVGREPGMTLDRITRDYVDLLVRAFRDDTSKPVRPRAARPRHRLPEEEETT